MIDHRLIAMAMATAALLIPERAPAQQVEEVDAVEAARKLELSVRDEMISHLLKRIDQLESRIDRIEAARVQSAPAIPAVAVAPNADTAGAKMARQASRGEQTAPPRPAEDGDRLIKAAFEQKLIERGGLLLPPRTYVLEPSISYQHSSSDNILIDGFMILPVLVVGDIVSQRIRRDQVGAALTARFGLPWDSQIEVKLPFAYQSRKIFSADGKENSVDDTGLGDVELALSHQIYKSAGDWPDVLGSLRWKTTTGRSPFDLSDKSNLVLGTGYDSLGLSLTSVKVVDPLVYFGGLSYTYNAAITPSIGRFKPGNGFGFSLGVAIALNLNSSLSLAYDQQFAGRSTLDGKSVPGSYLTTGVFSIGASYKLTNDLTVDTSLGIGVTRDSPDVLFRLSFPFRNVF